MGEPSARYKDTAWYEDVIDWHNAAGERAFARALADVQPYAPLPSGVLYRDRRAAPRAGEGE